MRAASHLALVDTQRDWYKLEAKCLVTFHGLEIINNPGAQANNRVRQRSRGDKRGKLRECVRHHVKGSVWYTCALEKLT